jgi:hypothetical protein
LKQETLILVLGRVCGLGRVLSLELNEKLNLELNLGLNLRSNLDSIRD